MTSLIEHLQAVARNNAWANLRLLEACSRLTEQAYRARRTSFLPWVHLTLNHIPAVDWSDLDVLDNSGAGARSTRRATRRPRRSQTCGTSRARPIAG